MICILEPPSPDHPLLLLSVLEEEEAFSTHDAASDAATSIDIGTALMVIEDEDDEEDETGEEAVFHDASSIFRSVSGSALFMKLLSSSLSFSFSLSSLSLSSLLSLSSSSSSIFDERVSNEEGFKSTFLSISNDAEYDADTTDDCC